MFKLFVCVFVNFVVLIVHSIFDIFKIKFCFPASIVALKVYFIFDFLLQMFYFGLFYLMIFLKKA